MPLYFAVSEGFYEAAKLLVAQHKLMNVTMDLYVKVSDQLIVGGYCFEPETFVNLQCGSPQSFDFHHFILLVLLILPSPLLYQPCMIS